MADARDGMMTSEELRTLVAEKVMEYKSTSWFAKDDSWLIGQHDGMDECVEKERWNPLESWADAHKVLDRVKWWRFSQRRLFLRELELVVSERVGTLTEMRCLIAWPGMYLWIKPADISLAALRVLGVEVK